MSLREAIGVAVSLVDRKSLYTLYTLQFAEAT